MYTRSILSSGILVSSFSFQFHTASRQPAGGIVFELKGGPHRQSTMGRAEVRGLLREQRLPILLHPATEVRRLIPAHVRLYGIGCCSGTSGGSLVVLLPSSANVRGIESEATVGDLWTTGKYLFPGVSMNMIRISARCESGSSNLSLEQIQVHTIAPTLSILACSIIRPFRQRTLYPFMRGTQTRPLAYSLSVRIKSQRYRGTASCCGNL